jgi:hypothetical protein
MAYRVKGQSKNRRVDALRKLEADGGDENIFGPPVDFLTAASTYL